MTSKLKVLIVAGLMALPFAAAHAQPAAHDWEVEIAGAGRAAVDFKKSGGVPGGQFGASLSLGYYVNDNVEVSARQFIGYATSGNLGGSTTVALDYNFLMDKLVPFIGVNTGYSYANRGGIDSWVLGPEAGVKYYLQSKAFIFGRGEYQIPSRGRDALGNGNWVFTLGIGVNM
jgi:hypothetical protein